MQLHKSSDNSTIDYNYLIMAVGSESESCKAPTMKKPRKEQKHGNLGETNNTEEVMDQHIWKDFPEDLFEPVIARLPIATMFQFRTVCKRWDTLQDSESFSRHLAQIPRSTPWFCTITRDLFSLGAIYDPCAKKWHYPNISSTPTKLVIMPVAAAGGLVSFLDIIHGNFYVGNPLTRSFKELPARSAKVWSLAAIGMTTYGDSASGRYMVLWIGYDGEYDSTNNSWIHPGYLPPSIKLPLGLDFRCKTVSIDETIHFMRSNPDGIVSYDIGSGIWMQFIIPSPLLVTNHTLAEHKGQLMLVGLMKESCVTCVCVWELQKMTLLWKEVDRMPKAWCLEFDGKEVGMTCLGNKGMLMLSLKYGQMNRSFTYDFSSREWAKVPKCGVPQGANRQWTCGAAFYPSFHAVA